MIYLQKSKKKSKKVFIAFALIILFLVIVSILAAKAPGPLSSMMHSIGMPFWRAGIFISNNINIVPGFIRSKSILVAENDSMKAELIESREKLMNLEIIKDDYNNFLQGFGRTASSSKIIATVLVRPPQTPYDMLIVDAGSMDGVFVNDMVYSTGGVILGTVNEVSAHSSNVTLFSRTDLLTPAFFERTNLAVTLRGIGGGAFEVEVPQESDVVKDDILIVPDLEPAVIGVVALVESSVKSAFKRVLIQTPTNLSYTRFVLIESKN